MMKKIMAVMIVVAAAGLLSVEVSNYLDSNEMTADELLLDSTGASDTLVTSGEAEEWSDMSASTDAVEESESDSASGDAGAENEENAPGESGESAPGEGGTETGEPGAEGNGEGVEAAERASETESAGDEAISDDKARREAQNAAEGEGTPGNTEVSVDSDGSGHQIEDFEIIYQMPELPTGCEVVALTMVLHYYGFDVDKTVMASEYLPTADAVFYYGSDGVKYGPDLNKYFVGDPFSNAGYICGTEAILTAANSYLQDAGSSLEAVDMTGSSVEELYRLVSQDVPIVVWVTIGMVERYSTAGWYTEEGEYVEWSSNDHGAVLIGYTEDTVTIADPISGLVEYSREDFESVFESRGNQCVILS
ncbi:MAG: C39 family peptidase [Lachnospiraceae bacterium]|nr:C39 family peptidase [Lachnospiraceae bacterium]